MRGSDKRKTVQVKLRLSIDESVELRVLAEQMNLDMSRVVANLVSYAACAPTELLETILGKPRG